MDEHNAERFGIVGFEALDHEVDGVVVLRDTVSKKRKRT